MSEQLPYLLYNEATGTGKIVRRKQPEGGFTGNLTRELKYEEYLNSLPSIPVHDDLKRVWKDGGKYYEGKDFELKLLTDKEQTPSGISRKYTHMAIPTTDKPQYQSVEDLIKELGNRGYESIIGKLRELLKGKIVTTPEAISKVWDEAHEKGVVDGADWTPERSYRQFTAYLKDEFGIQI